MPIWLAYVLGFLCLSLFLLVSAGSMVASRRGFSVSEVRARPLICFAAAAPATKKKADSADKRARQSVKRRIYNKSRKSEIRTRMKKVFFICFFLVSSFFNEWTQIT